MAPLPRGRKKAAPGGEPPWRAGSVFLPDAALQGEADVAVQQLPQVREKGSQVLGHAVPEPPAGEPLQGGGVEAGEGRNLALRHVQALGHHVDEVRDGR